MSNTGIKKNDSGVSVQGEHTGKDLLALGNIFHSSVVDAAGRHNSHLLRTTWWMSDVALRDCLLRRAPSIRVFLYAINYFMLLFVHLSIGV
jgi:hypothetical protein